MVVGAERAHGRMLVGFEERALDLSHSVSSSDVCESQNLSKNVATHVAQSHELRLQSKSYFGEDTVQISNVTKIRWANARDC